MNTKIISMTPLIQVHDMNRSLKFYIEMIGFSIVENSPILRCGWFHWCMIKYGSVYMMLNTMHEEELIQCEDMSRKNIHNDVGFFFMVESADEIYREFTDKGIRVEMPKNAPYGMRQLNVRDPDGYCLCFQEKLA